MCRQQVERAGCSMVEMESNKFDAIRHFFTHDAWTALSDFEKQVFCNMKANYEKLSELGQFKFGVRCAGESNAVPPTCLTITRVTVTD